MHVITNFMKRIIIADDHAVVRAGLQIILHSDNSMQIVDECATGEELLNKVSRFSYDAIILDLQMPGMDAFQVLNQLKKTAPKIPVVVYTMNNEKNFAIRMFQRGASAFINKEAPIDLLMDCLKEIMQGRKFYTPEQMQLMTQMVTEGNANSTHQSLTDREFQVMFLIASGLSKPDIAKKLSVSTNTIDNHRSKVLKKLQLNNNSEITRYAFQNGIVK